LAVRKPSVKDLEALVSKVLMRVDYLEKESVCDRQRIKSLEEESIIDKLRIKDLEVELINDKLRINGLEDELAEYKNPKNSGNSSIPPSKDENRVRGNQSLREKSGKKSGGQPGHKGNTLSIVSNPDQIVMQVPELCSHCGNGLSGIEAVFVGKRQVIELPPVQPIYVQHEIYQKQCSCGKVCTVPFPDNVKAPVQYGSSVANLVSYLSVRHYVPYKRTCEIFKDLFNIPLSEGSIANMLSDVAEKLQPTYLQIKTLIENSLGLGADETGGIIDGRKVWFWIWQNRLNTFITAAASRGQKVREEHFPNGFPNAVLSSDAYAVHLSTPCQAHQLCIAHLLRDLNYFIEFYPLNPWPEKLKALFVEAIELETIMTQQDYEHCPKRAKILEKFKNLLKIPPASSGKLYAFYKRMVKNQQSIFIFLHYPEVSPDNNSSERGVRNIKVKQKVSGQFKSFNGGQNFAVIRSVIDTWIKRGWNIWDSFDNMPDLAPE
jgi:transposase